MPNAISSLKSDHTKVRKLLNELEQTTERGTKIREQLLSQIEQELKIHANLEEEIFYPAFKQAEKKKEDREMFFEATEEHHVMDMVLPELKFTSPKSEQFGAKAKVLKELIEHHIREEEREMFAKAREIMSDAELRELGDVIAERREAMIAQWENPVTRPLKLIQSAVEKVMPTSLKNAKAARPRARG
jgi:hemerythrin-like domain-containing protein